MKLAYDSGVNFFDCADAYSGGAAERFLGETLKQYERPGRPGQGAVLRRFRRVGSARLEEAQRIIDRYNLYPITVVQPQYNLQDRYIEHEIMGTCRKLGIGITTFSPLAQGLLTGKYRKGQPLSAGSRATWADESETSSNGSDC